jgi:hypothetical protein
MNKAKFQAGRAFYQSSTHSTETGWYFLARNRRVVGPFPSSVEMRLALQSFIKACVSAGDDGRRYGRHVSA